MSIITTKRVKRMADCHPGDPRQGARPNKPEYGLCRNCYQRAYYAEKADTINERMRAKYASKRKAQIDSRSRGLDQEKAQVTADILDDLGTVGHPSEEFLRQESGRLNDEDLA